MSNEPSEGTRLGFDRCLCTPGCKYLRLFIVNPKVTDDGKFYAVIHEEDLDGVITTLMDIRDEAAE